MRNILWGVSTRLRIEQPTYYPYKVSDVGMHLCNRVPLPSWMTFGGLYDNCKLACYRGHPTRCRPRGQLQGTAVSSRKPRQPIAIALPYVCLKQPTDPSNDIVELTPDSNPDSIIFGEIRE